MTTGVAKSTVIVVPVNVTPARSSTNPTADSRNIRPRIWRELGGGSFLLCVLLLPWWWAAPPPCERWWCDDTPAVAATAFLRDSISRARTHQPTHTHTHTHTHKRKQKFQRTLQNNFDFNTLCKNNCNALCETKNSNTLCMQKQLQSALRNNCDALYESISTDFAKHAGQETQKNVRDSIRSPVRSPNSTAVFFSGGAGNLLLTF